MKSIYSILLVFIMAVVAGCAGDKFPQYSGEFELVGEPTFSDPSFKGVLKLPHKLNILNRADFASGVYKHYIETEFLKSEADAALEKKAGKELFSTGKFYFLLNDLMSINSNAIYGANVLNEPKITNGEFIDCWRQVQYYLKVTATPDPQILKDIYPTSGENFGQSSWGVELNESISENDLIEKTQLVEAKLEEWYETIEKNDGIILDFEFTRRMFAHPTKLGEENCILIPDRLDRQDASMKFTYKSVEESDDFDLREQDFQEITDVKKIISKKVESYADFSKVFFSKLVSEMPLSEKELKDLIDAKYPK